MQKLDASGTVVMQVDYDPFGTIISGSLVGEYGFSTKPLIDSLDWYYYGYRYYDAETGRWASRDPIGENGFRNVLNVSLVGKIATNNVYPFIANDPVNDLDLLGLASFLNWVRNTIIKGTISNLAGVGTFFNPTSIGSDPFSNCSYSSEDDSNCTDANGCPVLNGWKVCEYSCIDGYGLEIRNSWTQTTNVGCNQSCAQNIY
jgi:RHS repeat-associated protein